MTSSDAHPDAGAAARVRDAYAELLSRAPEQKMQPRLGPVRVLCELLGDPQRAFPVILITGTNGKTSTARMIERLLREHNLRTGRYTSPHLYSVTERIAIDGMPVSDEAFADCWDEIATIVAMVDGRLAKEGEPPLTFFELLTVMAYAIFADTPVDVAVVEVGLGGRWDATNVADPAVSVITPISLDHTAWLGSTVEQIAAEKSGIMRQNGFAVIGRQPPGAMVELGAQATTIGTEIAREGTNFAVLDRRLAVGGQQLTIQGLAAVYSDIYLPLVGEHQAHNAAIAIAATEAFLGNGTRPLPADVVATAMAEVSAPGRLEVVRTSPTILVDAAHNPGGVDALLDALEENYQFEHLVGVVGILGDKDADTILTLLEPTLQEVVITRSSSPRSIPVDDLVAQAQELFGEDRVHRADRLDDAIAIAVDLAEAGSQHGAGVLVTGSVTVAGEARLLLTRRPVDGGDTEDRYEEAELGDDGELRDPPEDDATDGDATVYGDDV